MKSNQSSDDREIFTLVPKTVKDDADGSTGPNSCMERVNRFGPGRWRSRCICTCEPDVWRVTNCRAVCYLIFLNFHAAPFLVGLFNKYSDINRAWRLIVINSTVHGFHRLLWGQGTGTNISEQQISVSLSRVSRTSPLDLRAKRWRPSTHPSILRNSSNSSTRRLQQK